MLIQDASLPVCAVIADERIGEALALFPGTANGAGIQFIQAALWTGLHEWLFLKKTSVKVEADLAAGILADFKTAKPDDSPRMTQLNAAMIKWLVLAQADGWRVPAPSLSLYVRE